MRQPKYSVNLSEEEIAKLRAIVDDPKCPKTKKVRAEILLDLDDKETPYTIIEELKAIYGVSKPLIYRLMKKFGEVGVEAVKKLPNPTPRRPHIMTQKVEETILSWIKTPPPGRKNRWSAYSIAEKLNEEGLAENISYQTVYRFLDKKGIKL